MQLVGGDGSQPKVRARRGRSGWPRRLGAVVGRRSKSAGRTAHRHARSELVYCDGLLRGADAIRGSYTIRVRGGK